MYGNKLFPTRSLRRLREIKGSKQHIPSTHNPTTIELNQLLTVRFSNLSNDDVVVPGTPRFSFNIKLTSKNGDATVVNNLLKAIVKKYLVKIEPDELVSIDDFDRLMCRNDFCMKSVNLRKLRVGTKDDESAD